MSDGYDIHELSRMTGITPRTIRYYVQERLLPPPEGSTRAARYGDVHVTTLRLIAQMRLEGLPLDRIASRLAASVTVDDAAAATSPGATVNPGRAPAAPAISMLLRFEPIAGVTILIDEPLLASQGTSARDVLDRITRALEEKR